jgi:hypothetical protein
MVRFGFVSSLANAQVDLTFTVFANLRIALFHVSAKFRIFPLEGWIGRVIGIRKI